MTGAVLHKRGFTLIELLLVIVIIGVLTGISVPSFVRSMQGNRLRSAARTVAAAGRYARSMAVLHQRPVAVTFAIDGHDIVVDLAARRRPPGTDDEAEDSPGDDLAIYDSYAPEEESHGGRYDADPAIRIERYLDGVRIVRVQHEDRRRLSSGDDRQRVRVVYGTNGRCAPHEIVLQDDDGGQLVIVVDALGGTEIRER